MKMHKNATKCNETIGKWCKNKHGASKIIDTFETYHSSLFLQELEEVVSQATSLVLVAGDFNLIRGRNDKNN
jgi:hypothetical protein